MMLYGHDVALVIAIEFFAVFTNMTDPAFLAMLYIWTDHLILSYVKMLSYAKDLICDICGQDLNNSELHIYSIGICTHFF